MRRRCSPEVRKACSNGAGASHAARRPPEAPRPTHPGKLAARSAPRRRPPDPRAVSFFLSPDRLEGLQLSTALDRMEHEYRAFEDAGPSERNDDTAASTLTRLRGAALDAGGNSAAAVTAIQLERFPAKTQRSTKQTLSSADLSTRARDSHWPRANSPLPGSPPRLPSPPTDSLPSSESRWRSCRAACSARPRKAARCTRAASSPARPSRSRLSPSRAAPPTLVSHHPHTSTMPTHCSRGTLPGSVARIPSSACAHLFRRRHDGAALRRRAAERARLRRLPKGAEQTGVCRRAARTPVPMLIHMRRSRLRRPLTLLK